jgi:apolipoprotein N-acyltransferase
VRIAGAVLFVLPWAAGFGLQRLEWTRPSGAPVSVAVIQGSISQDQKWLDANQDNILNLYRQLTEKVLGTQLVVWPESAVPAGTTRTTWSRLRSFSRYRTLYAPGCA